MKKLIYLSIILFPLWGLGGLFAQIGINSTNTPPSPSAMLDVSSTTKGMLIPRMTSAQRTAITGTQGLMVYDITTNTFWFHNGAGWGEIINNGTSYWTPTGGNTNLFSSYSTFTLGGGTNITSVTNDGTLRIFSPSTITNPAYLNFDATSIQARRQNTFSGVKTESDLKLNPFGGNVGIGLTSSSPSAKFHVGGNMKIDGTNTLEFGAGVAGKNINAGKIGYQTFGANNSLDIVGAGTDGNRRIKLYADAGTTLTTGLFSDQVPNLNIVPLGVISYDANFILAIDGDFATQYTNVAGNLGISSIGHYENGIVSDDYMNIKISLNPSTVSPYSKVVAFNTLNFDGTLGVGNGKMVRQFSEMSVDNQTFKAEVAVDDFPNGVQYEFGRLWGTVIFYGIK